MATRTKQKVLRPAPPPAAEPAGSKPGEGFFDPMAVTWMERYSAQMEKLWARLPRVVGSAVVTTAVFTLGATMNAEWLMVLVHFLKHLGYYKGPEGVDAQSGWNFDFSRIEQLFQNLPYFLGGAIFVSYFMYYSIGGFLHWFWYVRRRHEPHEWKCQPEKWLSPELERHEILTGSLSLLFVSSFTGLLACYVSNGGWSTVYYGFDEYGWLWFFLQWPAVFIYQDYATYWLHRIYHTPFLYKHFHKLHHKYKQPTAFSVTAIHPVEILHIQITLCLPIFIIPVHWVPFYGVALYTYYHGIIDHSGINFKSFWWQPWQPDAIFHDNHHQYFHVNFGFNIYLWDVIHGTYRRKDRVYNENIFYGKGVALEEASKDDLQKDLEERRSENPLAYRSNRNEFALSEGKPTPKRQQKKQRKQSTR